MIVVEEVEDEDEIVDVATEAAAVEVEEVGDKSIPIANC